MLTPATIMLRDTMGTAARPPQDVTITAPEGSAPLTGLAVGTIAYGTASGWLTTELTATSAPATLKLRASKTGLAPGTYTATIPVASSVASNSPQQISFTLQVAPPAPGIVLTPATIMLRDTIGAAARPPQEVTITASAGSAPLTGLAVGTIAFTGASGWLTTELTATNAPAKLKLTASKTGLLPGTYTAAIPVTSSVATNSPQRVQLTFQIAPAPPPPPPPPPPGSTITIVATANPGVCGGSELAKETAKVIAAAHPDYVFMMGDNVPKPDGGRLTTLDDYMRCYDPTWGQFKAITYATLGDNEVDITTTPPDYGTGMAPGADAYFGPARVGPPGKNWYSFDLGDWHIIALNVQTPGGFKRPLNIRYHANSDQLNWLIRDLDANRGKKCTLSFWYEAMWISSTEPFNPNTTDPYPNHGYRIQDVRGIWTALYEGNADLVINGWPYIYERFAPMRYAEGYQNPTPSEFALDSARGIRQITSGLAGDGPSDTPTPTVRHPLSEYRSGGSGVLKVVLGQGTYTWEFLNTKYSNVTDSGTGTCH